MTEEPQSHLCNTLNPQLKNRRNLELPWEKQKPADLGEQLVESITLSPETVLKIHAAADV